MTVLLVCVIEGDPSGVVLKSRARSVIYGNDLVPIYRPKARLRKLLRKDLDAFEPLERFVLVFVDLQMLDAVREGAALVVKVNKQVWAFVFGVAFIVDEGY